MLRVEDKVLLAIMAVLTTVKLFHLIAPTSWRWLENEQIRSIELTILGIGIGIIISIVVEIFITKRRK